MCSSVRFWLAPLALEAEAKARGMLRKRPARRVAAGVARPFV